MKMIFKKGNKIFEEDFPDHVVSEAKARGWVEKETEVFKMPRLSETEFKEKKSNKKIKTDGD